jgi:hypothetical protein
LEFARQLIRNTVSGDALDLAVMAARQHTGASDEEMRALLRAVQNERAAYGIWPEGF